MLAAWVVLFVNIWEVSPEMATTYSTSETLVGNLSVGAFLDANGYIRLNITWGNILCDTKYASIFFTTSEDCNPISDVDSYPLDDHFLIRPSMDLEHPADHIIHGCTYNLTFSDGPYLSQSLTYTVPECVQNRCQCRNFSDSPNKLSGITSISEDLFLLSWDKIKAENVTVHYVYYQRKGVNDSIKTHIPEKSLKYREDGVEISMYDLTEDVDYVINVGFIDEFNECIYGSSIIYRKTSRSYVLFGTLSILFGVVVILVILYKISLSSPKTGIKLKKYFFPHSCEPYENGELATPLSEIKREELNAQYTPLEFVLKIHKYDKFEFPRNKIITDKVLGEGTFGVVLEGKAYELRGKPGFTQVAVKKLKDGASEEQTLDFKAEIEMLKSIGDHDNIVKMLGCVTMDEPYLIIMELIPTGSLKQHLLKLREKWAAKRISRIFFPDDMDEDWFGAKNGKEPSGKLHYTSCVFDTSNGSYIVPPTPKSADSSIFICADNDKNQKKSRFLQSFTSMNSSRLPSSTGTEITTVDLETPSPFTVEINRLPEPVLDHTELQQFAFQIANGMSYLESISVTHRDLAARNILITSKKVLKISDFGMSRTGSYVNQKSKEVPLRWMAIESIESMTWDSKSDVWSFGVVLWEIGTLGAFPYERTQNVCILPDLKNGKRLERPKICTDELYELMLRCWSEKPEERPTFKELVIQLDLKKRKVYVDFNLINPKYVFPPTQDVRKENELKSDNK